MLKSTFISVGLHFFFILIAYYGLPHFKSKEPIEQPIDIVEDTPISSKTSLKLGNIKEKKIKNEKKENIWILEKISEYKKDFFPKNKKLKKYKKMECDLYFS